MAGKRGSKSMKGTEVPEKYTEQFMSDMDGRTVVIRNLRHRHRRLVAELGGAQALSCMEMSLCRRITHLERMIERSEMALISGDDVDINVHLNMVHALSSLLSKIGLKRRARQLPTLSQYLNGQASPPPSPSVASAPGQDINEVAP